MKSRFTSILNQTRKSPLIPIGLVAGYLISQHKSVVHAETKPTNGGKNSLPIYNMAEVSKHTTKETGYWLAFKGGVYDISQFVENHPGGKQILRTAGKALESCWKVFTIHQNEEVFKILEEYRIGSLPEDERIANEKLQEEIIDLFQYDPERINAAENFFIRSERPFNAETKPLHLVESFVTPVEKFYVRNHLHVPAVNLKDYKLQLSNSSKTVSLSYDELIEKFPSHTVTSVVQCAGNRRAAMNNSEQGNVQGTSWYVGAIGNARWTGVRLRDVLKSFDLDQDGKHVQFIGLDCDASERCYGASIPIEKAMNEDVLIVYEMNDEILSTDHGYPLRILVPGTIGARSVKWVHRIIVSNDESESHWQRADYKVLPSNVKQPQQCDYDHEGSLQEFNVQSAICSPASKDDGNKVKILSIDPTDDDVKKKSLTIKGYAVSGGGRDIQNVQISLDHGKTWHTAKLNQMKQPYMRAWAWTLWSYEIPFENLPQGPFEVVCRAMDNHANVQPDSSKGIWNIRGLMNNSWHRITLQMNQKN